MDSSFKHIFNRITAKSYRFSVVCLLIVLCILSSCAVRKSIQSFYSGQTFEYSATGKANKAIRTLNAGFDSSGCQVLLKDQKVTSSLVKSAGTTLSPFLFFILPGFLLSLFAVVKDRKHLPSPYSWLQWPQLALFLQHRLLLI